jgi:hypothetical protein
MSGIRAELVFDSPGTCPVANASSEVDGPLSEISWTAGDEEGVKEQFAAVDKSSELDDEFEEVFDYGTQSIYEFDRDPASPCICEFIEQQVGPVTEAHAADGDLHVTLHARDMTGLRQNLQEFKERFGDVRIEYLVTGRAEDDDTDIIPVDVRRLTDRQREVVQTAYEMGYFDYPRGANASEVAEELDIRPSTFTEHLNTAQSKILDELQFAE